MVTLWTITKARREQPNPPTPSPTYQMWLDSSLPFSMTQPPKKFPNLKYLTNLIITDMLHNCSESWHGWYAYWSETNKLRMTLMKCNRIPNSNSAIDLGNLVFIVLKQLLYLCLNLLVVIRGQRNQGRQHSLHNRRFVQIFNHRLN